MTGVCGLSICCAPTACSHDAGARKALCSAVAGTANVGRCPVSQCDGKNEAHACASASAGQCHGAGQPWTSQSEIMEAGCGPNCPLPTVMVTRIYAPLHSNGGHAGHGSQCIHSWLAAKAFTLHLMQARTDATMVSLAGRATIAPFAQAGPEQCSTPDLGHI